MSRITTESMLKETTKDKVDNGTDDENNPDYNITIFPLML